LAAFFFFPADFLLFFLVAIGAVYHQLAHPEALAEDLPVRLAFHSFSLYP
jgi:hypothetical protein